MKKEFIFLSAIIVLLSGCAGKFTNSLTSHSSGQKKAIYVQTDTYKVSPVIQKNEESNLEKGGASSYSPATWSRTKIGEWGSTIVSTEGLVSKAEEIKNYAEQNGYNSSVAFLVDMQVKSGKKRFFVYDLKNNKVLNSGLVAHGSGGNSFSYNKDFSNEPGSACTSLGIYKIGNQYQGSFGLAFKLYGLEETNNNAFKRFVVLHSMGCIPDNEINGPLCQSEGCPAVSPLFLTYLQKILNQSEKPVLLCIYR